MTDQRIIGGSGSVTVAELVAAIMAAMPSGVSGVTNPSDSVVVDVSDVPEAPKEVQGVHYHTALDLLNRFDLEAMQEWTARPVSELKRIYAREAHLKDEEMTRFYRKGVEWVPPRG